MPVPFVYRKKDESILANFNFTDIADGTGIVTYRAASVNSSQAFTLAQADVYSERVFTSKVSQATVDTTQVDNDFDVTFNLPRTIRGNASANVPILIRNRETGGAFPYSAYVVLKIRKWDGSTETDLASGTSETWSGSINPSSNLTFMFFVNCTVPITVFKKGETLRATIELHGWNTSGGSPTTNYILGHDPKNRATDPIIFITNPELTFANDPSTLTVYVPFVIDL